MSSVDRVSLTLCDSQSRRRILNSKPRSKQQVWFQGIQVPRNSDKEPESVESHDHLHSENKCHTLYVETKIVFFYYITWHCNPTTSKLKKKKLELVVK